MNKIIPPLFQITSKKIIDDCSGKQQQERQIELNLDLINWLSHIQQKSQKYQTPSSPKSITQASQKQKSQILQRRDSRTQTMSELLQKTSSQNKQSRRIRLESMEQYNFNIKLGNVKIQKHVKELQRLHGSIWYYNPTRRDFRIAMRAFDRMKKIRAVTMKDRKLKKLMKSQLSMDDEDDDDDDDDDDQQEESDKEYDEQEDQLAQQRRKNAQFEYQEYHRQKIFGSFTKEQRLTDIQGRELFLKQKTRYEKNDMLHMSHTYLKRDLLKKMMALFFIQNYPREQANEKKSTTKIIVPPKQKEKKLNNIRKKYKIKYLVRTLNSLIFEKIMMDSKQRPVKGSKSSVISVRSSNSLHTSSSFSSKYGQNSPLSFSFSKKPNDFYQGRGTSQNQKVRGTGVPVLLKKPKGKFNGELSTHYGYIQFQTKMQIGQIQRVESKLIALSEICCLIIRRKDMKRKGLEIYTKSGKSFTFIFNSLKDRQDFEKNLLHNQEAEFPIFKDPTKDFERNKFREQWQSRQINNFQYLSLINKFSDRSLNDPSAYPIYPWIWNFQQKLKTYPNDEQLGDKLFQGSNFRDLRLPTGAISKAKKKHIKQNQQNSIFPESDEYQRPFQIREPYSCKMLIFSHLVRLEPFTRRAINFDSSLDSTDRQFFSLSAYWNGMYNNCQDNKQLIPQFFFFPEFLRNFNLIDFGRKQDGITVHDIIMPEQFLGNPHAFIQFHRQLLESRYVSENLNEWINLIFGCYQQNKNLFNTFAWYSCEDYMNSKKEEDVSRQTIESLELFQQLPIKLFKQKHQKRKQTNNKLNEINLKFNQRSMGDSNNVNESKSSNTTPAKRKPKVSNVSQNSESTDYSNGKTDQKLRKISSISSQASIPKELRINFKTMWESRGDIQNVLFIQKSVNKSINSTQPLQIASPGFIDHIQKYMFIVSRVKPIIPKNYYSQKLQEEINKNQEIINQRSKSSNKKEIPRYQLPESRMILGQDWAIARLRVGDLAQGNFMTEQQCLLLQDFAPSFYDTGNIIAISNTAFVTWGHFDNSLRLINIKLSSGQSSSKKQKPHAEIINQYTHHDGFVNFVASDSKWVFSGSENGTTILWKYQDNKLHLQDFFCDHECTIIQLSVSVELGVFVSLDEKGNCFIRHLMSKKFLRSFNIFKTKELRKQINSKQSMIVWRAKKNEEQASLVNNMIISKHGYIMICSRLNQYYMMKTFSCNGELVSAVRTKNRIKIMQIDLSHDYIVSLLFITLLFYQFVVYRNKDFKVHVFNIITLQQIEMDHPMFPQGLIQLNNFRQISEEKKKNIRAIYPMEGMSYAFNRSLDSIIIVTQRKIFAMARNEQKQRETELSKHIGLVGFIQII